MRWRAEEEKGVLRRQWAPEKGGEEVRANDGWAPSSKSERCAPPGGAPGE